MLLQRALALSMQDVAGTEAPEPKTADEDNFDVITTYGMQYHDSSLNL